MIWPNHSCLWRGSRTEGRPKKDFAVVGVEFVVEDSYLMMKANR